MAWPLWSLAFPSPGVLVTGQWLLPAWLQLGLTSAGPGTRAVTLWDTSLGVLLGTLEQGGGLGDPPSSPAWSSMGELCELLRKSLFPRFPNQGKIRHGFQKFFLSHLF